VLVSHIIEDIRNVLSETPQAARYRVGAAKYVNEPGGDIAVSEIGCVNWDDDEEFFLVPDWICALLQLQRKDPTTDDLVATLTAHPEIHNFVVYVRETGKKLPDGSTATLNMPIWGTGVHHDAQLVYFYFGDRGESPNNTLEADA
jgi:hypothetical protein